MAKIVYNYMYLVLLLVILFGLEDVAEATERTEQHPARDFSRHTLIKPKIYHGREKRQVSTTKEEGLRHTDHLVVTFPIDGEEFILDLILNKELIPKGFFRKVQQKGTHVTHTPGPEDVELCQYNGKIRNRPDSWVALSTCDGLSGVIFDGEEMHYVQKNSAGGLDAQHFLYKHSDLLESNKTCGYPDGDASHPHQTHTNHNRFLRYKRAAESNELVRGPYNANKDSKYVELVLVIDNREYKELGESTKKVETHAKNIANIINALYSPLNIFIALVGVVIWTEHDEISFSSNGDTTLTNFLHYRREKLVKEHPNDNAQLLTKFNFEYGVVGKALKGPICTYEYSGGVNTDHSPVVGLVATTVAHEMGHNFGMEHDTNECKCKDDRCIMAPSSSTVAPTHWSSCSLNYLLLAFTHGMDYCLKNKPIALFDSPVCGNGFVEPGEQCDCGLPEHCDNTCCNAVTCALHSNASCATGECCDLTTCKPKGAGTMCRSADYECDLPEYCTGQSEYCPSDIYKMDTEACDDGKAFCYQGFCRTRTDQCRLLWGKTGESSDEQCYKMNVKGSRHGNCGYNKFNQTFFKCDDENVLCGMLHCKHLNERLEFGMESVSILSHSFLNLKGSIVACRTAIVDLGVNQVDPGLAPDGAKCGFGKMCVNQRCMAVDSLKLASTSCPHNCNENGWCNNLGHCHCKTGFAPPYCTNPGPGGSEDSGPATNPNARKGFVAALFIIFLGFIPGMVIIAFLIYYLRRNNILTVLKKPSPPTSKSPPKSRNGSFSPDATKRTEDNHSLLQEEPNPQNEFFGQFRGFTLTKLKFDSEPVRTAPPPPKVAIVSPNTVNRTPSAPIKPPTSPTKTSTVTRAMSFKQNLSDAFSFVNNTSTAPALPPPNPGSNAKLIISSPILENSTCTAKELISPLKHAPKVPVRAAPEPPVQVQVQVVKPTPEPIIVAPEESTRSKAINRIASFLKTEKKPVVAVNSLPRPNPNQIKANKIDKNALRTIEISNPILQENTEIILKAVPVGNVVMRAQSMRGGKSSLRPNIPTFGSMRQTNFKRPMSIPSGTRPKSPPPPAPPNAGEKKIPLPSLPGYQKPSLKTNQDQYDDCLNKMAPLAQLSEDISPTSSDNIYAVIEESPIVSPEKPAANNTSPDGMGLLSEIVSEIQNRNFDSIYSTSTLARKKKEEEERKKRQQQQQQQQDEENYVNASSIYKSPSESIYSNMTNGKSSASSTSSGYINPSSVNVPVKTSPPKEEAKLSSFKAEPKPFSKPPPPLAVTPKVKSPPASPSKGKVPISRQKTPPNLRTRKPSPSRAAPVAPRPASNSPDLVTSCNSKASVKTPDVLNGGVKKPVITTKPSVGVAKGVVKAATKPKTADVGKTAGVRSASRSSSNVASLQQKFENKTKGGPKVKT